VDAEKGETRIRHRVDERVRKVAGLRAEDVVVAAEGHDPRVDAATTEPCEAVGVDAGAKHRVARRHLTRRARKTHTDIRALGDALHLVAEQELAPRGRDIVGKRPGYEAIIDDPGARHVQRPNACRVRLQLSQALRLDQLEPRGAVLCPAAVQLLEPK